MMNQQPPELFADRPIRSDFDRGVSYRVCRIITVAVLLLLVSGGFFLMFGHANRVPAEIPVLTAEGAYKQKPEQPGGIDIPHQDVEVYQALGENAGGNQPVEHLLPAPETPKLSSAAAAPLPVVAMDAAPPKLREPENPPGSDEVEAPDDPTAPAAAPTSVVATTVSPQPDTEPKASAILAASVAPKAVKLQAPVTAQPKAAKPAPKSISDILAQTTGQETAAAGKVGTVIQLASVSDPAAGAAMAKNLQTKYDELLGGTTLRVVKADLGVKGVFYRIQSQPVSSDLAGQICQALKNRNAGCLIVRH